ncbi:DUF2628 domain-containing protein [Pseudoroseomonas cervicalis]|uniref:DUF2628 domain-containing protein n=1 Tax=Teichococcus cervicalis TaxID=204525 RepID=UPI0022F174F6|nr:DUF2628 domain-containing protein [Pseudoroseomonas cervicalis]WBV43251.1 DUF2628 domain-containing protein [Pseudoroseomonas cervicalis]
MRAWTVHPPPPARPAPRGSVPASGQGMAPPAPARRGGLVLVPEGFAWGALLFGPLWLLAQRLWIPLLLWLALAVAAALLLPEPLRPWLALAAHWLLGLQGQDLRRWALARRGRPAQGVVLAADHEAALSRALAARPDWAAAEAAGLRPAQPTPQGVPA